MRHRKRNPFTLKSVVPSGVFGKQMLTDVVGGAVGYFGVKKLPSLLPASWNATGNTWQGWAAKIGILLGANFVIGSVLKRPQMARSVFVGGAIAIITDVLSANIPQLSGTGYFIPNRQLSGTGSVGVLEPAATAAAPSIRKPIVTTTGNTQARWS